MRSMYFKRAKIFLEQTDKGEQRFLASVGGPVQVPNWVCKTLGYKLGCKDGSIVDVTPPKVVAPIVEDEELVVPEDGPPVEETEEPVEEEIPEEEPEPEKAPKPKKSSRAGKGTVR